MGFQEHSLNRRILVRQGADLKSFARALAATPITKKGAFDWPTQ